MLDGKISGWLSANVAGDGAVVGELMFWNCTDNIVTGNTFLDQGTGIFLYGGSGNTIWGNTFFSAVVGATNPATVLNYGPLNEGVNESESGDLIYNNYFDSRSPRAHGDARPGLVQLVLRARELQRHLERQPRAGERFSGDPGSHPHGEYHRNLVPGWELLVELRQRGESVWGTPLQ